MNIFKSKPIALITALTFLFTTTFEFGKLAYAIPLGSIGSAAGPAAAQMGQIADAAGPVQSFQADLFTGRAQTGVPIFVPPGRKNVQPGINLSYSSTGGNSWVGHGWALDMGFIQRDVKNGVPKYDSTDTFVVSFQGVYSELVEIDTDEYRAKDEALFLKFEYDSANNYWIVTDKSGTQHFFGLSANCRQSNGSGTFKWSLSKVADTKGNYMSVTHTQDGGQTYLSSIDYNGNEDESFAHTHKVEFTLEDRPDDSFSYITGSKVETNKWLQKIEVKVKDDEGAYQLARKYVLGYTVSASTDRSLLTSVTEYGTDGTTSLPVVEFTYQVMPYEFDTAADYSGSTGTVKHINNWSDHGEHIQDLTDVNGDGWLDRIFSAENNTAWDVQWGSASGFSAVDTIGDIERRTSSSSSQDYIRFMDDTFMKMFVDLADLNGDGRPDRVIAEASNENWEVQFNTGDGFDSLVEFGPIERRNSNAQGDYISYTSDHGETKVDLADVNGDGFPDRILAEQPNTNDEWMIQWNTGSGFTTQEAYGPIETRTASDVYDLIRYNSDHAETIVDFVDMNGDGLPDRVQAYQGDSDWEIQWNTGTGFTSLEDFGPIERGFSSTNSSRDLIRWRDETDGYQYVDLFDLNADGLPDRVQADGNGTWEVQWNTGTGFTSLEAFDDIAGGWTGSGYKYPRWVDLDTNGTQHTYVEVADINGDGLVDRIQSQSGNGTWKVQENKGPYPDLLSGIDNGRGGSTTIEYTSSALLDNTDENGIHRLPFPLQVVAEVTQSDGMENSYVTSYSYEGGMYDAEDREFRGFKNVTVTDAAGTETRHTFGQTDHNKGRILTKEVWGYPTDPGSQTPDSAQSKVLFSKEETTWSDTHPYTGVHFVHVTQQDNYLYDGDETVKQVRQAFTYDSYGNLASTTEYGDVSAEGDERKTVNAYVYNTTDYIVNTLKQTTLYDDDTGGSVVAERYFYYDQTTSISTAPTDGLLFREEEWLSTASGCGTPGVCANNPKTTMTYDSYGNVATVTDARGYITTNTYDSTYHLFLIEIENALTHTRSFTYDPWIAQILTSTDQNGEVTETIYDVLGRVTKVIAPLDTSAKPTQEFAYDYPNLGSCGSTCTTRVTTKVKSSIGDDTLTQLITYSFTDGLGREIQRRSPDEDTNKQIVTGILEFDARGQVSKQYVPFLDDTSTAYRTHAQMSVSTKPKAAFSYDAVGRRTRIDYPDSTNSKVVFNDFEKTTTDQRSKNKRYTNDAYGRLVKVEEFNAGNTYTTTYEYDLLNNLKKTIDHLSNETTITYDSLSRKTGMNDPDMGEWEYEYDGNDNLTSQTDAKDQTIAFTYDELNRVTLKNLPAGETDVTYTYDDVLVDFSIGRLTKVVDASGAHEFEYDELGRVVSDTKTVDSVPYTFTRTYDSMGRVRTLTYPDTEVVTYTYNLMGDVETISGLKSSVTTDYLKDADYNASGQLTHVTYGNDVTSDYTYDTDTLRLDNILTKKPDGTTKLQDLSYAFDGNGNVTQITDTVNAMSQTFAYDDLNRLTQAIGSAYGTENYVYDAIGNMTTKGAKTLAYGAGSAGPHAVTSVQGSAVGDLPEYCRPQFPSACSLVYDANGNMTVRGVDALEYDSENRLTEVTAYRSVEGTHNFTLDEDWNVISFTYLPEDKSVSNVLGTEGGLVFGTDYDQVSTWDEATDTWKHWVNDPDFNDFDEFEQGKSYEINVIKTGGVSFSVDGESPAVDITHNIMSGDNFVSPAVTASVSVASVLSTLVLDTDYSDVKRFDASTQTFESWDNSDFTDFEPGKGYIIVGLQNASFDYGEQDTVSSFIYDSTGVRVKKTVDSSSTIYLGKDYAVESSLTTKYIFIGDRRIAYKDSTNKLRFLHDDHISSSNVITDESGDQDGLIEYDPYGTTVTHTGNADPKHKFTGQEEDADSSLYFYGGRYYDPQLGRFITADPTIQHPTDPQDFNRYAYARNNPIVYTDPTGFGWLSSLFAIVAAVIVTIATYGVGIYAAILFGAIAGAIGGIAGAAIEGSSLMKGAINGAIMGAGVTPFIGPLESLVPRGFGLMKIVS